MFLWLLNLHAQVTEDVPVIPAFTDRYTMNSSFDGYSDLDFNSFSSESYLLNHEAVPNFTAPSIETSQPSAGKPTKKLKMSPSGSSYQIISFGNSGSPPTRPKSQPLFGGDHVGQVVKPKAEVAPSEGNAGFTSSPLISQGRNSYQIEENMEDFAGQGNFGNKRAYGAMSRSPLHAQDHVIAERKRREKLSQRFIALTAVIPGLKKVCEQYWNEVYLWAKAILRTWFFVFISLS